MVALVFAAGFSSRTEVDRDARHAFDGMPILNFWEETPLANGGQRGFIERRFAGFNHGRFQHRSGRANPHSHYNLSGRFCFREFGWILGRGTEEKRGRAIRSLYDPTRDQTIQHCLACGERQL